MAEEPSTPYTAKPRLSLTCASTHLVMNCLLLAQGHVS